MVNRVQRMVLMVVVIGVTALVLVVAGQATAAGRCDPVSGWLACDYAERAVRPTPTRPPVLVNMPAPDAKTSIVPFTYGYVFTGPVSLYTDSGAIAAGSSDSSLARGYVWVRITGSTIVNGQRYYRTKTGAYISASVVTFGRPSAFEGVVDPTDLPLAWVLAKTQSSASAGAPPDKNAPTVSRYQVVHIYEEQAAGDSVWYRIGENQWIERKRLGIASPGQRPAEILPGQKWIEVNLFEQTLMAYEGDRMVYATLVSSGLPGWDTATGVFRAWAKVRYGEMYGAEGKADYYYLEDVPWTIYFYDDYAIHGAYWHDGFGYRHSHGCVNVPPVAAKWLFEWTDPPLPENQNAIYTKEDNPGVWVWVHN
jgi:hypothetical protein